MYTLSEAGLAVGRSKEALAKAIKRGRISAHKDDSGQWRIDPAELHRVYPLVRVPDADRLVTVGTEKSADVRVLEAENRLLREERDRMAREREDMMATIRSQAEALAAVKLLTDQRLPEPVPEPAPPPVRVGEPLHKRHKRRWWQRRKR